MHPIAKCLLLIAVGGTTVLQSPSYVPPNGFVPDERTAIDIAEAVLTPIYGKKLVASEQPFHAKLGSGIWTITGSLPADRLGGVATVELSQRDGRIIAVTHGR